MLTFYDSITIEAFKIVIPAPHQVRDKLQRESRPVPVKTENYMITLDSCFHRNDTFLFHLLG